MILVTGATGHLGSVVVHHLLKKVPANQVAALVRDASKAVDLKAQGVDIRIGNYDDTVSLDNAMRGVEKVLLVSSTEGNRPQQHRNVVAAAKNAGVQLIAYTSRNLRDPGALENALMREHFETEEDIKASGLASIIFRNALYMDAVPLYVGGERALTTGFRLPAEHGKVAYALRSEQGEAIANALAERGAENRLYKLTGSEAWSFDDVADALSMLSGNEVAYTPIDNATFGATLRERGVPELQILRFIGFMVDIKNGQEDEVTSELEALLGRRPASLQEGLRTLFNV